MAHKNAVDAIKAQEVLCPLCGKNTYTPYDKEYVEGLSASFPAMSRRDNETLICSQCGQREAMEDFQFYGQKFVYYVMPQYKGDEHAKVSIILWDRGGHYPTSLDWGDEQQAKAAATRINTFMGYDQSDVLDFVAMSLRVQNELGR